MSNFSEENGERLTKVNERITLIEKRGGQSFGADAFLLAAYAVPETDSAAVDLGCGTGICSLLLADRNKASKIYAVELQAEQYTAAIRNIQQNKLDNYITALHTDIRLLSADSFPQPVKTVIANPPYFTADSGRQSPFPGKNAARFELNGGLFDFCAAASRILTTDGRFYCVIRPKRLCDLITALRAAALEPKKMTFVCHNKDCAPSMVLTEAGRSCHTGLCVTRPLFLYEKDKNMTADADYIYKYCDFGELFNE